jgi:hypothetical protein
VKQLPSTLAVLRIGDQARDLRFHDGVELRSFFGSDPPMAKPPEIILGAGVAGCMSMARACGRI